MKGNTASQKITKKWGHESDQEPSLPKIQNRPKNDVNIRKRCGDFDGEPSPPGIKQNTSNDRAGELNAFHLTWPKKEQFRFGTVEPIVIITVFTNAGKPLFVKQNEMIQTHSV